MATLCVTCGRATAVGIEMGYLGLPSLDETPRGRGKHPLSKRLSSGGDADTDETFGSLSAGLRAVGLSTHALEAYRDFLKAHSKAGHALRSWAEDHEDLPAGARKPRYTWYKIPKKAPGFVRAHVRFTCAKCDDVYESPGAEWARPLKPRVLTKDDVKRLASRTLRPSEHNVHDAWPFGITLFDDLDDWLRIHGGHGPRIELVPESAGQGPKRAARGEPSSALAPWSFPPVPREEDDRVLGPVSERALPLLARLHHRDPDVRASAARAVSDLGEPGTLGHLAAALDDPEAPVRVAAVEALGALEDARKLRPLGTALLDEAEEVRAAARRTLAGAGLDEKEALAKAREPRASLHWEAVYAHGAEATAVVHAVDPRYYYRSQAASKLEGVRDRALLLALGDDYSPSVVRDFARPAGEHGLVEAVPALCEAARSLVEQQSFTSELNTIVLALGKLGASEALPVLVPLLDAPGIYYDARRAVAAIPGDDALRALTRRLASKEKDERREIAGVLGERGDRGAVRPLVKALRDSVSNVRSAAAGALALLGDPVGLEEVVALASAGDYAVASGADVALIQIGDPRTEAALVEALNYAYPREPVATTYLLCGHPRLAAAGRKALRGDKPSKHVTAVAWGSRPLKDWR